MKDDMSRALQRLIIGLPTLTFIFLLIFLDASGEIDVNKWGYSFFGGIIMLLVNFYFRKK